MSIKIGNKTIANKKGNSFDLLDFKWSDHILNNPSWLRSDTFSWQSGEIYQKAYNHLADDLVGIVYYDWSTPNVGNYYTEHRWPTAGDKVYQYTGGEDVFEAGTVESYDSVNDKITVNGVQYSKYSNFALLKNVHTYTHGSITIYYYIAKDGHRICLDNENNIQALYEATGTAWFYNLDSDSKQFKLPREEGTGDYLYFYVGNFSQTELYNTAGIALEALNKKVEKGHEVIEFQAPTASNNYTWYRKYADGWVEQGGYVTINGAISATNKRVTFPVIMDSTRYFATASADANIAYPTYVGWMETTGMSIGTSSEASTGHCHWEVKGMYAQ